MQVNKTNPSFGMAFKFDENSLAKATPEEIKKVANTIWLAGQDKLDEASKFCLCKASAVVDEGKISKISIFSCPDSNSYLTKIKTLTGMFQDFFKREFLEPGKVVTWKQDIEMKDFNAEKLLSVVGEISEKAMQRFGSAERAKNVLKGLE